MDPFSPSIGPVCIPDLLDLPSFKVKNIAQGTFSVGTLGVGFIACNPLDGMVNNLDMAVTTTSAFAGNAVSTTTGATVLAVRMAQAPYVASSLSLDNVQARLVGFGMRCRYTGTELNRGGRLICYRASDMSMTSDLFSPSSLLNNRTTITVPVTRKWSQVTWLPSRATDYQFVNSSPATVATVSPLVLLCEGGTTGNSFEFEVVGHYEYTGLVTGETRSHVDLPGMSAIRDAVNATQYVEPGASWYQRSIEWISNNGIAESSGPILGGIARDMLRKKVGV